MNNILPNFIDDNKQLLSLRVASFVIIGFDPKPGPIKAPKMRIDCGRNRWYPEQRSHITSKK